MYLGLHCDKAMASQSKWIHRISVGKNLEIIYRKITEDLYELFSQITKVDMYALFLVDDQPNYATVSKELYDELKTNGFEHEWPELSEIIVLDPLDSGIDND